MSSSIGSARRRPLFAAIGTTVTAALLLAGCSGADLFAGNEFFSESSMGVKASPRVTTSRNVPKGGGRYVVGKPYTVAGNRFVPREQPDLDVTGRASWYGPAFHGRLTANGEIFDMYSLSAAHPTLPLPSYVRVTNADTGATTIVRVNDRGPFSYERTIDLSRRAAEVLGFQQQGTANVRVQYIGPAPLEGDDTKFLVASINQLTPYEIQNNTRMAFQEPVQVADTAPAQASTPVAPVPTPRPSTATEAAGAIAAPEYIPFRVLSYVGATSLETASEPTGTPLRMALGTWNDEARAREIATRFAVIGAVDTATLVQGDQTVTHLMLTHLREGVTETDAVELASSLGLSAPILY
ncbi:septal ring lytic transglycosylase RlpA family protein [Pelagibacterium halotolerans]|uniref:Endolytic peptidoglycan transglycosylase RlpA n=1 Tax=Pelagibacterium halotolerans (strain DSM 22347 / JCM 15775 / CGMCC 1.7692 / B2) TaxID=1082931 RepID=G4R9N5_PELHB|nr:septal ring lytic transglycosylase RlpA family protein [Pelagibacterium halotolerans]AEQ51442.1 Rare lipoprotein A precursor [Pelagibacterium halotolerans B2]QJR18715.1 septal ring lytic transglycosylase RlpA family protein [Pelagibacterium halotolerans]SEA13622.1 rare lipoprotein A [Pelagibacterium halotolerans]